MFQGNTLRQFLSCAEELQEPASDPTEMLGRILTDGQVNHRREVVALEERNASRICNPLLQGGKLIHFLPDIGCKRIHD